jgi:hypothetical protein
LTYCDTFVGRLKNPGFDWSDPKANLCRDDIEFLTGNLMDDRIFSEVLERSEMVPSRRLDRGSIAIEVTKEEVLALMNRWVPGVELPGPGDENHKPKQSRARSLKTVKSLPGGVSYLLVTEEF